MGKVKTIVKAKKVKFTAGCITDFQCPKDKAQAFLWCDNPVGLAVRATAKGAKSYIFQTKVKGQSMRVTIGDVRMWSISAAQAEARRLQVLIDNDNDPCQVKADAEASKKAAKLAKEAQAAARVIQEARESVTLGKAWLEYIAARKLQWGEAHHHDHIKAMQAGGKQRTRSPKLTTPGTLASLAAVRLVDLTPEVLAEWAEVEGVKRPTRPRPPGAAFIESVFILVRQTPHL